MILQLYAGAASLGLINGLAILLVNPRRTINQAFFAGSLITAVWIFSLFMTIYIGERLPPTAADEDLLFWLRMSSAAPAFLVWQIAIMHAALSEDSNTSYRALRRSVPWLVVSACLAILAFSEYFVPSHSTSLHKLRGPGYSLFMSLLAVSAAWLLVHSVKNLKQCQGIKRLELQLFVSHALLASIGVIGSIILSRIFPSLSWLRRLGPIWITVWQGSIVWAICHHKIFEGQQVVALVGQRLLLVGLAGICALGLHYVLSPAIGGTFAILISGTATAALAVFCDPLMRQWLGLDTLQLLHARRTMLIARSRESLDEDHLTQHMQEMLKEWCKTDYARLWSLGVRYRADSPLPDPDWQGWLPLVEEGWITPESLQRQKSSPANLECSAFLQRERLAALLAVPKGSPSPSLLVGLGRKQSLRPYTYPDILLLLNLTELMDNILTHARVAARLAQIEKLESAAMMSRSLAHDLNNLATPVSSFLLHMESRVQPGTAEAEVLADAKHSLRVMQDYIRESLFFARRLVPDFRLASSAALLASTAKVTQTRAGTRGVNVIVRDGADISFTADATLLQRLLQNLVFNGIDATPRDGTVTLAATALGSDRIQFSIADEGPGVPPELTERIFEPYFTTKDTGDKIRGLGLGLAVSQKIANLHNGTINVGRTASGGALFTVTIPLQTAPAS